MVLGADIVKPELWYPGIRDDHPLARKLEVSYPFWEPIAPGHGSQVRDYSGNRYHGTIDAGVSWGADRLGRAPDFTPDGGTSRIAFSTFILSFAEPWTILWSSRMDAYTEAYPGEWIIKTDWGTALMWLFHVNACDGYGPLWFGSNNASAAAKVTATNAFQAAVVGTQQHYAYVFDGVDRTAVGSYKLYRNGLLEPTGAGSAPAAPVPTTSWLGTSSTPAGTEFDGTLSYFHIVQQAMPAAAVRGFAAAPWDMFRPRRLTYFFPAVQQAGAPSGQTMPILSAAGIHNAVFHGLVIQG